MIPADRVIGVAFMLFGAAWVVFLFPEIYYRLSAKMSINILTAWKRYMVICVILVMTSPLIYCITFSENFETALNIYVNSLVNAPYFSLILVVLSICSIYVYHGNFRKTRKASIMGSLLASLNCAFYFLATIFINLHGVLDYFSIMIFTCLFMNACFIPYQAVSWQDFFSGKFGNEVSIGRIRKTLKKGDELYNEVPEFRKFVDEIDAIEPLGKKTISIKMATVDEAYQYAWEWVTRKSVVVFWDRPKVIIARRCFEPTYEYGPVTEDIIRIFIVIKIKEGDGQVDIETSLFPIKETKWEKPAREKTLKVLDEFTFQEN